MTSYFNKESQEAHSDRLALFYLPETDVGIESLQFLEYRPSAQTYDGSSIEFSVYNSTSSYLDLKNIRLYIKCQLLLGNGDKIPDPIITKTTKKVPKKGGTEGETEDVPITDITYPNETRVSVSNLFGASLFRQVDVKLNQQIIGAHIGTNYPYKSYFDVIMGNLEQTKKNELTNMFYRKEYSHNMDILDPYSDPRSQIYHRQQYVESSKIFDMECLLFSDMFQIDRYLLNNVDLSVKLYKNEPNFCLVSSNDKNPSYKVKIIDSYLRVPLVKPSASLLIAQSQILNDHPAIYPYMGSVIKSYSVSRGERAVVKSDLFNGDVPSELIIGMVSTESYMGNYNTNPFLFKSFNCNYLAFQLDGQNLPFSPLNPNFDSDDVAGSNIASTFSTLFLGDDKPNISRNEFLEGYSIFKLEITKSRKGTLTPQKRGFTKLEIHFEKELPEPITILVYGKFQSMIKIDKARNIIV